MRLLQRLDTGAFSLTKDLLGDDTIPPYAILSHTWVDGQEVTYQDLEAGTGGGKSGYDKLWFCAEQAKRDGLQYFWVDTCCIDKSNHAELSREINTMFRRYCDASRCYVYLFDVPCPPSNAGYEQSGRMLESAFRRSRWFTRGWTLQELLAPTSVEFFSSKHKQNQEYRRLGDKSSLRQWIHEITGIPHSALEGSRMSQFSVEEWFMWSDRRETTKPEDKIYSLLGIFDVEIPLFYGEGATQACARLREVIDRREKCMQDLCVSDPRDDKKRIEETKGGLLKDSYHWILENSDFRQWHSTQQNALLWVKGDPGKGKTMLFCGVIDKLDKAEAHTSLLSYFFCQATDARINNGVAVLRGLVHMLVRQQPSLVSHVRKKYDQIGRKVFEDANAWFALCEMFISILQDLSLTTTYVVIDALDECMVDLQKLLDFIAQQSTVPSRVKWIVSSRNLPDIEERLNRAGQKVKLSLELNADAVSTAVGIYIQHKTLQLAKLKNYDDKIRVIVLQHLISNANDTFLWVALVCQNLENTPRRNTLAKLNAFPPGLDSLYQRMMEQIYKSEEADLCKQILALTAVVYRPVTLRELTSLVEMPEDTADDLESLREIIGLCGSFLTVRKGTIYFVHQSAKDYLLTYTSDKIFPSGRGDAHYAIFSRSLQAMSKTLQQDMYKLCLPGISANLVQVPNHDPLAALRYSCVYWASHFNGAYQSDLNDDGIIHQFLQKYFLYWLEALSLIGKVSEGVLTIASLESYLLAGKSPNLQAFIDDARRFVLFSGSGFEQAPLQLYYSALLFTPKESIVRRRFEKYLPTWIEIKPKGQENWSGLLQTLEGHSSSVNSVVFSPDGKLVASGSDDKTVRLWDARTGAALQKLEGHFSNVNSVVFSPDSKLVASGSYDKTVRLWDARTGAALQTLEGHSSSVYSVVFSPDSKLVASGSDDNTVRLWDTRTGAALQTLEGHSSIVNSAVFSPDGKLVASGLYDKTVRLWDARTGAALQTLEGHSSSINSVVFSPDGKLVASGSYDKTVRLWDARTGAALQTLKGHFSTVYSVVFSPDSKLVASGSYDKTVRLWDTRTGAALQTLEGHSSTVYSIVFSPNGKLVASGSGDETVRLWDARTGAALQTLEGHSSYVNSVVFSPDGKLVASGSDDKTVRLWDTRTGAALQTLEAHSSYVNSVVFSPDGKLVASGSDDKTVRLWDTRTGAALQTLEGHSSTVNSVVFSPDGKLVASGSDDKTVRLWDTRTGAALQTLEAHSSYVNSVVFSPDGKLVASGSDDKTVRLWDARTGAALQKLEGHFSNVNSVVFSPDSKLVASGSDDNTVRLWDARTGAALQTLEGHSSYVYSVVFSPDSKLVASGSYDKTVRLWDAGTGAALQTLEGHSSYVNSVVFSPDGKLVASGSGDETVRLWDARTGAALQTLEGHSSRVSSVTFWDDVTGVAPQLLQGTFSPQAVLVDVKGNWVTLDGKETLWLPPEYRPMEVAVYNRVIAIGCSSGRIFLLQFYSSLV